MKPFAETSVLHDEQPGVGGWLWEELMRTMLLGLVLGAGAGLGVGLLCAPVSGKKARNAVRENVNRVRETAVSFVHERREHFDMARMKHDFAPRHIDDTLDDATMEALAGR